MNTYKRHRFPPDIIPYAVWLYYRFNLSHRDIDEVFAVTTRPACRTIQINGKQHYLWRAVDQDGEKVYVYLQSKRNGIAAKRFFKRLLRSYPVAHRELMPDVIHSTKQYENNRAEQSHENTRVRERGMRKFKSARQAQRFVTAHAIVSNLFNLGRHKVRAQHYRDLRISAFTEWSRAVA